MIHGLYTDQATVSAAAAAGAATVAAGAGAVSTPRTTVCCCAGSSYLTTSTCRAGCNRAGSLWVWCQHLDVNILHGSGRHKTTHLLRHTAAPIHVERRACIHSGESLDESAMYIPASPPNDNNQLPAAGRHQRNGRGSHSCGDTAQLARTIITQEGSARGTSIPNTELDKTSRCPSSLRCTAGMPDCCRCTR